MSRLESARRIRVLIVDDSAIVRKILSGSLEQEPDIEVVGTAPDAAVARDKVLRLAPDVLTLDVEMPGMDGLTFLKKLMRAHPLPVIMISSIAQSSSRVAIEALAEGAVEVLAKPAGPYSVGEFRTSLARKIRAAAASRVARRGQAQAAPAGPGPAKQGARSDAGALRLIAIGASTGGTEAIERILVEFPASTPPIVITQHIPAGFSRAFAQRLDGLCRIRVREAANGDRLEPGLALVAPGNFHMRLRRAAGGFSVRVEDGELVCYQRPAVDVLFHSVAAIAGSGVAGVLLTGMGSDGAAGMLALRQSGAHTIAQDEASSAVFGMPREAIRMGAAVEVLALSRIASRLMALQTAPAAALAR
jgi:two-component system, chemotaxis family, protein-glutamate methylesterase/glutaminase